MNAINNKYIILVKSKLIRVIFLIEAIKENRWLLCLNQMLMFFSNFCILWKYML